MIDSAPLITLRRLFGALVVFSTLRFISYDWIDCQILDPLVTFPFEGFEWLPRPNRGGAYTLFAGMLIGGVSIMTGKMYKAGCLAFFLCFTYVELLDKSNYLNHYYFVSLLSFLLCFMPANKPGFKIHSYLLLTCKLLIVMVYFFAGLAKLNGDWLLHAQPLTLWLPQHSDFPLLGQLFQYRETAYAFSWFGALFDLMTPFALFSNRARKYFYPLLVGFHIVTWMLFPIGIFPWIMIACTTVFFSATSHRIFWNYFKKFNLDLPEAIINPAELKSYKKVLVVVFLAIQFIFPLRHLMYSGNYLWHEAGYRFGWRVMLIEKSGWANFFVVHSKGNKQEVDLSAWLTKNQEKMVSTQPDMIVQFAHHLSDYWRDSLDQDIEVHAEVWVSLNGRRSQLFVDPNIDLSSINNTWAQREYVVPMDSVILPSQFYSLDND